MKGDGLRRLIHMSMLGFVLLYPWLGRWGMAAVAGAAFLLNILVLPRSAVGKRMRREGERSFAGMQTYPLAVALGWVLFPPEAAAVAWAVLAVGDPGASLQATGPGEAPRARLPWNRDKSWRGSTAFVVLGAVAACLVALWMGYRGEPGGLAAVGVGAAAAGALAESVPWPFDDNLPVLLAAGGGAAGVAALM